MSYLLAIAIIIVVHECGHLLMAFMLGLHVEMFVIFLNPWFSLYKRTINYTKVAIGWLPLGGYIKITERDVERADLLWFYSGGILANIFFGVLVLRGNIFELFGKYFKNNMQFNGWLELTAFLSLIISIINLIPFQGTDGNKILKLLR